MSQLQQSDIETLQFKIGLSGTFWEQRPNFSILLNDVEYASDTINVSGGEIQYVIFVADLVENSSNQLKIRLENKSDNDTIVGEDGTILKDMLLNIESIEIDEMELSQLKWSLSEFVPDSPDRPVLKNCVNLGWNGSYVLNFDSPFYLWLLEKL